MKMLLIAMLVSGSAMATECSLQQYRWEMDKNDAKLLADLEQCHREAEANAVKLAAQNAAIAKLPLPRIGMTRKQAEASRWGSPDSINSTMDANGVREQWVYGRDYLYFTNGRLSAIQTPR